MAIRENLGVQGAGDVLDSWSCGARGVFRGDETHAHTQDKLTMAPVTPQILKPYATLLLNVAGFCKTDPKGIPELHRCPRSPPSPAKPPPSGELSPLVFTVVRNSLKRFDLFVSNYSAICHNIYL